MSVSNGVSGRKRDLARVADALERIAAALERGAGAAFPNAPAPFVKRTRTVRVPPPDRAPTELDRQRVEKWCRLKGIKL